MIKVRFFGIQQDFRKVAFTQLLMRHRALSLVEANKMTDKLCRGGEVKLSIWDMGQAGNLMKDATRMGALAEMLD